MGGGIVPWYRIDAIRLTKDVSFTGYLVTFAEIFFVVSTFYYIVNMLAILKKEGMRDFCANGWNLVDCFTVALSVLALIMYTIRLFVVADMNQRINQTR